MKFFSRFLSKNQDSTLNEYFWVHLMSTKRKKAITLLIIAIVFLFSLSTHMGQTNASNVFKSDEKVAKSKIEKYIDSNRELASLLSKGKNGKALELAYDNQSYYEETILKDDYIKDNYDTGDLENYLMEPLDTSTGGVMDAEATYGEHSGKTKDMMATAGNYLDERMDEAEEEYLW